MTNKVTYRGAINLNAYKDLLKEIIQKKYHFKSYDDIHIDKKHVVLRHDIDFFPKDALKISSIEEDYKVSAHYFFLVDTDFYNISSKKNKIILQQLIKQGHNIGLHYNPLNPSTSIKNNENNAKIQIELLENIIQRKVRFISFHRPDNKFLKLNKKFCNRLHTYMPRFFQQMGYISDSGGVWKYGIPTKNKFFLKEKAFQLLIHPEWWRFKTITNRNKVLKFLINNSKNEYIQYLRENIKNFSGKEIK